MRTESVPPPPSRAVNSECGGEPASATAAKALAILTYHSLDTSGSVISVAPSSFAEQMACLADAGVRGISLRQALAGRAANGRWPDGCVGLTFDDGYANMHSDALPILARHGFTATVFLISGHVGRRSDWAPPPTGLGILPMLTWSQVAEMSSYGVEIGAHTRTHPDLGKLPEADVAREVDTSRAEIEDHVAQSVESFAYPFGSLSPVAVRIASRAFRAACTTVLRRATDEPLHQLPRVDMYYFRTRRDLTGLVSGELDRSLTLRRWARSVRRAVRG